MSFAFVQDIAATWQQYERFASAIAVRPEGLVLQVAGPTDEGFRIIGVWESESAWERFKAEFQLDHAPPGPPTPSTFRALQPKHVVFGRLPAASPAPFLSEPGRGHSHG
jgi:hypothetical protein